MFEGIVELIDGWEASMKFREEVPYRKHYEAFGERLAYYYECKESGDETGGLEPLMLAAYRWMKFIRTNCNVLISQTHGARPLDTAIMEAVSILDEPVEYCVPYYREADALECLSLSAFVVLKRAGEVKHCKYCQKWLNGPCKAHKEPTSVEDLFYCKGCGGYMKKVCPVHGPDEAM